MPGTPLQPRPRRLDRSELERAWEFIKETDDPTRLEAFIRQFGDSPYAHIAQARLEELRKRQTADLSPTARKPMVDAPRWAQKHL